MATPSQAASSRDRVDNQKRVIVFLVTPYGRFTSTPAYVVVTSFAGVHEGGSLGRSRSCILGLFSPQCSSVVDKGCSKFLRRGARDQDHFRTGMIGASPSLRGFGPRRLVQRPRRRSFAATSARGFGSGVLRRTVAPEVTYAPSKRTLVGASRSRDRFEMTAQTAWLLHVLHESPQGDSCSALERGRGRRSRAGEG